MPGETPETQALIDLLKSGDGETARDAFKEKRRDFMPALNDLEVRLRTEFRAVEEAEAKERREAIVKESEFYGSSF